MMRLNPELFKLFKGCISDAGGVYFNNKAKDKSESSKIELLLP